MCLRVWCFIFVALGFGPAHAGLVIKSVDNASYVDTKTSTTNPIIYGGTAGPDTNCTDNTELCDSCDGLDSTTLSTGCNLKRIHEDLILSIRFTIDSLEGNGSGTAMMADDEDNIVDVTDASSGGNGDTVGFDVVWGEICDQIGDGGACDALPAGENSEQFKIGIDADGDGALDSNEFGTITIKVQNIATGDGTVDLCDSGTESGICDFTAKPGDEKIYIKDPEPADDFPQYEGLNFTKIRVFYSDLDFFDAIPGNDNYTDIKIETEEEDGDSDLAKNNFTDLKNDVTYFVRIGAVDDAQNVAFITSDTAITDKCGDPSVLTAADDLDCDFMATPAPVFGILSEDVNCFITTAAYGSSLAPQVRIFREFRNRVLLRSEWGRYINLWYYKYGSRASLLLSSHPEFKPVARALLWPLLLIAQLYLSIGALWASLVMIASLFSIASGLWLARMWWMRKRSLFTSRSFGAFFKVFIIAFTSASLAMTLLTDFTPLNAQDSTEDTIGNTYFDGEEEAVSESEAATEPKAEPEAEEQVEFVEEQPPVEKPKSNWKPETVEASLDREKPPAIPTNSSTVKDYVDSQLEGAAPGKEVKIHHPNADKGLIRITSEGDYIYRTNESKQKNAASLRLGIFDPVNLENPDNGILFSEIYEDSETPMLLFDYEWQLFRGPVGVLTASIGSGFYVTTGQGRFENDPATQAEEEFTFFMFPLSVGGTYRLQFWDRQPIVPYGCGGAGYWGFAEYRDDKDFADGGMKLGGAPIAYWAGGVAFNLNFLDRVTMIELDQEYGINRVWFTAEYRSIIGTGDFDFTSDFFNVGFLTDF